MHKLITLGPDALPAVRKARDAADDPQLEKVFAKAVTWIRAGEILPTLEKGLDSQLTFDGQYSSLSRFGPEGIAALVAITDDSATNIATRIAACRALADIADASLLPRLREIYGDILIPQVLREQLGILLAVFGDQHAVARDIKEYTRFSSHKNLDIRLSAMVQLSNLYYRIRDYKKAVEYYEEILTVFKNLHKRQKNFGASPRIMKAIENQMTIHYYNAACSNSLFGDLDRCKEYLRKAVKADPVHYENIEKDGDLSRLRADPSYKTFRKELGKLFEGTSL